MFQDDISKSRLYFILFQALTALIVVEFFPYKFVRNEDLKNLLVKETDLLQL